MTCLANTDQECSKSLTTQETLNISTYEIRVRQLSTNAEALFIDGDLQCGIGRLIQAAELANKITSRTDRISAYYDIKDSIIRTINLKPAVIKYSEASSIYKLITLGLATSLLSKGKGFVDKQTINSDIFYLDVLIPRHSNKELLSKLIQLKLDVVALKQTKQKHSINPALSMAQIKTLLRNKPDFYLVNKILNQAKGTDQYKAFLQSTVSSYYFAVKNIPYIRTVKNTPEEIAELLESSLALYQHYLWLDVNHVGTGRLGVDWSVIPKIHLAAMYQLVGNKQEAINYFNIAATQAKDPPDPISRTYYLKHIAITMYETCFVEPLASDFLLEAEQAVRSISDIKRQEEALSGILNVQGYVNRRTKECLDGGIAHER